MAWNQALAFPLAPENAEDGILELEYSSVEQPGHAMLGKVEVR
jgi:hypothetical protein